MGLLDYVDHITALIFIWGEKIEVQAPGSGEEVAGKPFSVVLSQLWFSPQIAVEIDQDQSIPENTIPPCKSLVFCNISPNYLEYKLPLLY